MGVEPHWMYRNAQNAQKAVKEGDPSYGNQLAPEVVTARVLPTNLCCMLSARPHEESKGIRGKTAARSW